MLQHLQHLVAGHAQRPEQRVGQGLLQVRLRTLVRFAGEGPQVEVVGLGQAQQDLGRHRSLVALQVVQVARRDAQVLGHARLGQAEIASETAEPAAEEELAFEVL